MMTVKEVSKLTGITIRTLHHYDAIGLLRPTAVTDAGYRLYNRDALERLQTILLFRELEFPLSDIKAILDTPGFDRKEALSRQIHLLELQKDHIEKLISHAKKLQQNGGDNMNFSAYDNTQLEQYAQETKERWGNTPAYTESQQRTQGKSKEELQGLSEEMMQIFAKLGQHRHKQPDSQEVQALVSELQQYITKHFYNCTNEIFACLGQMYAADDRFRENIDCAGGEGTAAFTAEAICIHCQK